MHGDALLGIIGGILVVLLGLLISMLMSLKRDVDDRDDSTRKRLEDIKICITRMVQQDEYKEDKKDLTVRLDEQGERLLVLEIRVKEKQ